MKMGGTILGVFFVLLLILVGGFPAFLSQLENLFVIQHLRLSGLDRLSEANLLRSVDLEYPPKKAVWEVDWSGLSERIKSQPWVEGADFRLSVMPLVLDIEVKEAKPWLIAEYEHDSWLVSESGSLVQPLSALKNGSLILETADLARLDGLEAKENVSSMLNSANARFKFAIRQLKILREAGEFPFVIDRYSLLPDGALELNPGPASPLPKVIISISSANDATDKLERLRLVLSDSSKRLENLRNVDLRFLNQAIVK